MKSGRGHLSSLLGGCRGTVTFAKSSSTSSSVRQSTVLETSANGSKTPPAPTSSSHAGSVPFGTEDDFPVMADMRRRRMSMSDADEYKRRHTPAWSADDAKTRIGAAALDVIEAEQAVHQLRIAAQNHETATSTCSGYHNYYDRRSSTMDKSQQPAAELCSSGRHDQSSIAEVEVEEEDDEDVWRKELRAAQQAEQQSVEGELKADLEDLLFLTSQIRASRRAKAARRAATSGHRRVSLEMAC